VNNLISVSLNSCPECAIRWTPWLSQQQSRKAIVAKLPAWVKGEGYNVEPHFSKWGCFAPIIYAASVPLPKEAQTMDIQLVKTADEARGLVAQGFCPVECRW
jgi:hypothetical protein